MGNSIGGRIKELRLLQGMTQEKLAELCDTSVSSIARWESGSLHPNMKHQERLAEIFGMRIDDFYINLDTPVTQDYILSAGIKGNSKTGFRGTEVRAAGYSGLKQIKTPQISIE